MNVQKLKYSSLLQALGCASKVNKQEIIYFSVLHSGLFVCVYIFHTVLTFIFLNAQCCYFLNPDTINPQLSVHTDSYKRQHPPFMCARIVNNQMLTYVPQIKTHFYLQTYD